MYILLIGIRMLFDSVTVTKAALWRLWLWLEEEEGGRKGGRGSLILREQDKEKACSGMIVAFY